ncbi:hypothetical protein [Mesorhizobium sp. M6A.T.Cr.TU.016.01.1.1]|uniref:hypothetical protein n=1 Tax=Mesorhizobium sp. M6A.T.Cr.TU.016.01.1.1 TaxID=2493677 RepID=UPI000F753EEA|nr:hypothetical protein [Mesorhizobium sp. M6A.T.Cr.TU.016.01.1.1]AZO68794.1 hypothetical protein EJ075_30360 [Mesorhizobium sp. M6A.T.Cr.TU.016.01.1.1]
MRFLFVALFMVLATHVSAQEAQGVATEGPAVDKKTQGNAEAGKGDAWKSALPVTIMESPDQANHASERETKSDKHEAEDLDAQVRAANAAERGATATERQVIPTYAQAIFGLIGMGLLVYTLILNSHATNAAAKAAEAAIAANQIASRTSQIELRAWIGFNTWHLSGVGKIDSIDAFEIVFEWINTGSTPAYNTVAVTAHASGPAFKNGGPDFDKISNNSSIISPSRSFFSSPIFFRPEQIVEMRDTPAILRSIVRYDSVFEDIKNRISDVTLTVHYIGRAGVDELRSGNFDPGNFRVSPTSHGAMT